MLTIYCFFWIDCPFRVFHHLGSVLLIITASNPNWEKNKGAIKDSLSVAVTNSDKRTIELAFDVLDLVSQLPAEYKNDQSKIVVLMALFEKMHNGISPSKSYEILKDFKQKSHVSDPFFKKQILHRDTYYRDLRGVALLKRRFKTTVDIIEAIQTIPELDELVDFGSETGEEPEMDIQEYLESLNEDIATHKIGSLIPLLWSGLNIPTSQSSASNRPLGGISDLTNKGEFDKLLISEFAYDDLTFMSRLANSESLFYQREIPPMNNDAERILLVDVSIKNWGTIKLLSLAAAIAICKHPKSDYRYKVYAVGDDYYPLKIDTKEDVLKSSYVLSSLIDGAPGVTNFFEEEELSEHAEVFWISTPEASKKEDVLKVLSENGNQIKFIIEPEDDGAINVYKNEHNQKKHVQTIRINLKEAWKKNGKVKTIVEYDGDIPLLLSVDKNNCPYSVFENKVYIITKDFHLLSNSLITGRISTHKGWKYTPSEILPFKGDFAIGNSKTIGDMLLTYDEASTKAVLYHLDIGESFTFDFRDRNIKSNATVFYGDIGDNMSVFVITDGENQVSINGSAKKILDIYLVKEVLAQHISVKTKFLDAFKGYLWTSNVLKHLRKVGVTQDGKLIINKHELMISNHLSLKNVTRRLTPFHASEIRENTFQFANGSVVTLHQSGMLMLQGASAKDLIFIPSVLERSIGAFSADCYCGVMYHLKQNQYRIIVKSVGKNKLESLKIIRENAVHTSNIRTAETMYKNLKDRVLSTILTKYIHSDTELEVFENELTKNNMEYEVETAEKGYYNSEYELVSVRGFDERFITPFIQDIIDYEV